MHSVIVSSDLSAILIVCANIFDSLKRCRDCLIVAVKFAAGCTQRRSVCSRTSRGSESQAHNTDLRFRECSQNFNS